MEIGFDGDLQSVRCYYPVCLRETECASIKVDSSRITIFLVFTFASISAWINAGPAGISEVSNMHDYIVTNINFLRISWTNLFIKGNYYRYTNCAGALVHSRYVYIRNLKEQNDAQRVFTYVRNKLIYLI